MMWRCHDCGEEFSEPAYRHEHENHPEVDGPYREEWYFPECPACGSEYIEEGELCEWCGIRWASIDYCEECVEDITDMVSTYGKRKGHTYTETLDFVESFVRRHW